MLLCTDHALHINSRMKALCSTGQLSSNSNNQSSPTNNLHAYKYCLRPKCGNYYLGAKYNFTNNVNFVELGFVVD